MLLAQLFIQKIGFIWHLYYNLLFSLCNILETLHVIPSFFWKNTILFFDQLQDSHQRRNYVNMDI